MEKQNKKYRIKGTGSIFKRGKTYYLQYMVYGKLKKVSLKCTNKKDAEKKAKELLIPIQTADTKEKIAVHIGEARNIIKGKKLPLNSIWNLYLKNSSRPDSGPATLKRYGQYFKRLQTWLKVNYPSITDLTQITEDIVQEYADYTWNKGISGKTFNAHFQAIKLITNIVFKQYRISNNPFDIITKKREEKQSRKEFTEAQVIEILNSFDDSELYLMHKAEMRVMFNLGAWTGLRLIDCALMEWKSINLERNFIHCIPQKTKKVQRTVTIPIHPSLRQELYRALEWQKDEFILPQIAERYKRNPHGIQTDATKVLKHIGLETTQKIKGVRRLRDANIYGFHSFRHSFVSFCAKAGVPLPVVQAIVGHGNPAITRHYIHIGEESVKQAINALPQGKQLLNEPQQKTDSQKLKEISEILDSKSVLTNAERQIISIISCL
jgi:integrase